MKLKNLTCLGLKIPFKSSFKHASAERSVTDTAVVIAESYDQQRGFGESCPRTYVTGESVKSCEEFLNQNMKDLLSLCDYAAIAAWVSQHAVLIDQNPAAWCAIEMALLDLLGKSEGKTIDSVLGLPEVQGTFSYSAVLGVSAPKVFDAQLSQYVQLGITDFKIKVSGELSTDNRNVKSILEHIPHARLRIDANNLWRTADEVVSYFTSLNVPLWALEEPLSAGNYIACRQIGAELGCKIILDESFLRMEHLEHIRAEPNFWIPNIRISKMGGLLRSLLVVRRCKELGMRVVVGAQVGETSLLTRAALSLVNAYRDSIEAQEGAFGTYLLERDIAEPSLMFGQKGLLKAPLQSAGLGVKCSL